MSSRTGVRNPERAQKWCSTRNCCYCGDYVPDEVINSDVTHVMHMVGMKWSKVICDKQECQCRRCFEEGLWDELKTKLKRIV